MKKETIKTAALSFLPVAIIGVSIMAALARSNLPTATTTQVAQVATPAPQPIVPQRVTVASSPATFATVVAETGCESKFSDAKKADIFVTNYKNKEMTVTGEVKVNDGDLALRILRSTLTFDVIVKLSDPKTVYDVEKDERVTVTFIMRRAGGCFLPYSGDQGRIR